MNTNFGVTFILCYMNFSAGNGLNGDAYVIKKARREK